MLDGFVSLAILADTGGRHRFEAIFAVLERRNRHGERIERPLTRAGELERLRGRLDFPARWRVEPERAFIPAFLVARHFDLQTNVLFPRSERYHHLTRAHGDCDRWHDVEHARLVAVRKVRIQTCDRLADRHAHAVDVESRDRYERRLSVGPGELRF